MLYTKIWCLVSEMVLRRRPGVVARSEASSLCMQAAPSSIPTSGTFFRGDLVMKTFLRPFSFFHWFKKSSCQLLAKECALSTGKLPRRLGQEQCGQVNWPLPKWPRMCWRAVKQKSNQTVLRTKMYNVRTRFTCTHENMMSRVRTYVKHEKEIIFCPN